MIRAAIRDLLKVVLEALATEPAGLDPRGPPSALVQRSDAMVKWRFSCVECDPDCELP
jgi:hypothetical protein